MDMGFSIGDHAVFFCSLAVSLSVGIIYAVRDRTQTTPATYFLADKTMHFLPVAFSLVATFQSSILILGIPAEAYAYGMKLGYFCVGILLASFFSGWLIVPVFHALDITSVYKYFELRYKSRVLRYVTLMTGMIYNIFYMGVVIYGACVALNVVMGLPYWATTILYTVVTVTYTSLGGMKAVIWTDVIQLLIIVMGIIAMLIKISIEAGGIDNLRKASSSRLDINDFRLDPRIRYQFWNTSLGSFISFIYLICTQAGFQRVKSAADVNSAKFVTFIFGVCFSVIFLMAAFEGVAIFAYYAIKRCDLLKSNTVRNINGMVPFTVLDIFGNSPGLPGLFIAALTSASLSTLSSSLNSLAAVTYEDVLCVIFPTLSDQNATRISKAVVAMYGLFAMGATFVVSKLPGSVFSLLKSLLACIEGSVAAVFVLSIFVRRNTAKGTVIGLVCGMVISLSLTLGQTLSNMPTYPMLPPGPIDQCPSGNNRTFANNSSEAYIDTVWNTSLNDSVYERTTFKADHSEKFPPHSSSFYALSFTMLGPIGFCGTICVSVLVSCFTKPPEEIAVNTMFSKQQFNLYTSVNKNVGEGNEHEMLPVET